MELDKSSVLTFPERNEKEKQKGQLDLKKKSLTGGKEGRVGKKGQIRGENARTRR